MGLTDTTTCKIDKQQGPIGNYIHYLIITYDGKEPKKEYIYNWIYVYI